ncbi:hypothetical protein PH586_22720 [Pseudomonas sp. SA3-5]|uniref:Uncharacterized protein n=1 Tax=Pseudomonas aestuarii TaxID=3018340 RepID=A0ABT4XLV2_9PSED|nr:hypothetical protein [Pseudomonas aestuarii]MDA7089197.1 hypothetical protein [Pseudomonas aestuarii]
MRDFTYNPDTVATQPITNAEFTPLSSPEERDSSTARRVPTQAYRVLEGDRLSPQSPEARREPATTVELEQDAPTMALHNQYHQEENRSPTEPTPATDATSAQSLKSDFSPLEDWDDYKGRGELEAEWLRDSIANQLNNEAMPVTTKTDKT